MEIITKTKLSLPVFRKGKVRDTYDLGDSLLMVATDRISAFDVVFHEGIPYKGIVLTQLSLFWFELLKGVVENHLITDSIPDSLKDHDFLARRSLVVKKAKPLPVECIVRGYLSGSGWKDYKSAGAVCGIELPKGLRESEKLPEPLFTPSTKADVGQHDENIGFDHVVKTIGKENANNVRDLSLKIYKKAADHAEKKGLILADTKFEFGVFEDMILLIDEVLTPDSSRFWLAKGYSPGKPQQPFDKQFVRNYLESTGWNKSPPPPALPLHIIKGTSERYIAAYEMITGLEFKR
ncbi:MAG: phosphoribosylaminoimidazolesuccinocarboxamide synthase [Candidatus Aenigmarchaeota archaeon]|nr:phosphoribosylaminoimidazolesuccinocarboxamide synthase [Candidatus Aenigmarchaeota archaeon]